MQTLSYDEQPIQDYSFKIAQLYAWIYFIIEYLLLLSIVDKSFFRTVFSFLQISRPSLIRCMQFSTAILEKRFQERSLIKMHSFSTVGKAQRQNILPFLRHFCGTMTIDTMSFYCHLVLLQMKHHLQPNIYKNIWPLNYLFSENFGYHHSAYRRKLKHQPSLG